MGNYIQTKKTKHTIPKFIGSGAKFKSNHSGGIPSFTENDFKLVPVQEVMNRSMETNWIIENYLPAESTTMLFGKPGCTKSLMLLDMAFSIGLGIDFHGEKVTQSTVVYVAGEGFIGLAKRFKALQVHNGMISDNVYLSEQSVDLNCPVSTNKLIESMSSLSNINLIIVDTLHRNFTGDENSSKDIAVMMKHCDDIRLATGASIAIAHHIGHKEADRGRGSSSIKAALDVEYKITKTNNVITMDCTKAKDIEEPKRKTFSLKIIDLGFTKAGEKITSPVLETLQNNTNKARVSNKNNIILNCLNDLLKEHGAMKAVNDEFYTVDGDQIKIEPTKRMVNKKELFDKCEKDISVQSQSNNPKILLKSKKKSFNRSLEDLINSGLIACNDDARIIKLPPKVEDSYKN